MSRRLPRCELLLQVPPRTAELTLSLCSAPTDQLGRPADLKRQEAALAGTAITRHARHGQTSIELVELVEPVELVELDR